MQFISKIIDDFIYKKPIRWAYTLASIGLLVNCAAAALHSITLGTDIHASGLKHATFAVFLTLIAVVGTISALVAAIALLRARYVGGALILFGYLLGFVAAGSLANTEFQFASFMFKIPVPEVFYYGDQTVVFQGGIKENAAQMLQTYLDAHPDTKVLELNSVGGEMDIGLEMANLIEAHHLITYVPPNGICASTCPALLVAGQSRYSSKTAKIGLHKPINGLDQKEADGPGVQPYWDWLTAHGVSSEAIARAKLVIPPDLWDLTPEEAKDYHLVDGIRGGPGVLYAAFGESWLHDRLGSMLAPIQSEDVKADCTHKAITLLQSDNGPENMQELMSGVVRNCDS